VAFVGVLALLAAFRWLSTSSMPLNPLNPGDTESRPGGEAPFANRVDNGNDNDAAWPNPHYLKQAERESNLEAYANDPSGAIIPAELRNRPALLDERARLHDAGDAAGVARLNAVLSTEAFERAAQVTVRWLDRRDGPTGLFPHTLRPKDRYFSYGDVGADLYPFLAIATRYLVYDRYPEILDALDAERNLSPGFPRDRLLDTLELRPREPHDQMLADVEYAKDGLLPLVELLGPDPWLGRMLEVTDAVITESNVPTARGPIPSDAAEVNGSMLQVLARLSWQHDDPRYVAMGRRIAGAYLDDTLPVTGDIPPERWDFTTQKPVGDPILHLGDHGDEIVSGVIEWERVERRLGLPEQAAHRAAINRMLVRLLNVGRSPGGLWYDGIHYPTGKVQDRTLNDNWGYLGQAYLDQASVIRSAPMGDEAAADRFEQSARDMLTATSGVRYNKWERGDMDGYADTLESALYLLRYLDDPGASAWVDQQMAVLYGFQRDNGAVTDENIDGNYIRTAMLYGRWLTQSARVEPWSSTVALGAAADGACLQVHLHAADPWSGRLLFDGPRHQQNLGLDVDYPRLNQWQEWWTAEPGRRYTLTQPDSPDVQLDGAQLASGILASVSPGQEYQLRVCPA
jgi:hypothetical protein